MQHKGQQTGTPLKHLKVPFIRYTALPVRKRVNDSIQKIHIFGVNKGQTKSFKSFKPRTLPLKEKF